jgi:molybdenum cofactor synthesis domain-containing protein
MLAAIIGVGSELTSGQIIDKNSSWISKQLKDFGIQTSVHLVVPDDRPLILQALDFCAGHGDTLFVTGGLGPTSDDFTRDLISEWAGAPMVFDEASWQHVCDRLSSRSIAIRDIQKQQCFFPQGAEILKNPEGTANGFHLRVRGKDLYVLPGPPSEIAAIWKSSLELRIQERAKGIDKHVTYSWDTLGLGESDVAHLTENALKGVPAEKGYRVHLPYVEVKLSFLESQRAEMATPLKNLEQALHSITVARNGQQVPELLVANFAGLKHVAIVDALSGKYLLNRLTSASAFAKELEKPSWTFTSDENLEVSFDPAFNALKLVLKSMGTVGATAEIHYKGRIFKDCFEAPKMIVKNPHRRAMYFAEQALIFWWRQLEAMV